MKHEYIKLLNNVQQIREFINLKKKGLTLRKLSKRWQNQEIDKLLYSRDGY